MDLELDENKQDNDVVFPFASHFGTNYTPTDDELLEIHNLIVEPSTTIAELEVEMAQKAAEYDAIVAKLAKLKQLVTEYRVLTSPMRRLPIDLLREVFYHCLPTEHNAVLSYREVPAVLTRVCSTWRAIALATPALWASLHIPVPQPLSNEMFLRSDLEREEYRSSMEEALRKRTRAMQEWLARSGACRLSITLHDSSRSSYALPNTNYWGFLSTIISHSKRWRSITFTTSADHLRRVAALTAENVPELEELVINMTSFFSQEDGNPFVSMVKWAESSFLNAPRLHRVSFNNLSEDINTLPIRWQQLTHISLTGISVGGENMSLANIAGLLAKCPGLISARLERADHEPAPFGHHFFGHPGFGHPTAVLESSQPERKSPIMLPSLTDLSLQNGRTDISPLLAMLEMPRLTTLQYHTNLVAEPADELIALVRRVSETLVSFTTNSIMFSREDFFSILKTAHRLKSLSNKPVNRMESDSWGHLDQRVQHFDDIFLGMLVGRRVGQSKKRDATAEEKVREFEVVADGYSRILLPELESFDSRTPVNFTDEGLLECLKIRQCPVRGNDDPINSSISSVEARTEVIHTPYTKLKHFSAAFDRGETRPMSEDISLFTKAGLALHLSYYPIGIGNRFSPAEGIAGERVSIFNSW